MQEHDIREIVERVVKDQDLLTKSDASVLISSTITSTMIQLGINDREPLEMQKDMAHAHKLRVAGEKLEAMTWKVVITTVVSGTLGLIWIGFQAKIKAILGMT